MLTLLLWLALFTNPQQINVTTQPLHPTVRRHMTATTQPLHPTIRRNLSARAR